VEVLVEEADAPQHRPVGGAAGAPGGRETLALVAACHLLLPWVSGDSCRIEGGLGREGAGSSQPACHLLGAVGTLPQTPQVYDHNQLASLKSGRGALVAPQATVIRLPRSLERDDPLRAAGVAAFGALSTAPAPPANLIVRLATTHGRSAPRPSPAFAPATSDLPPVARLSAGCRVPSRSCR